MKTSVDSKEDVEAFFTLVDYHAQKEIPLLISMLETTYIEWKSLVGDSILRKLGAETTKLEANEKDILVVIKAEVLPTLINGKLTTIIQELQKKLR